MEVKEPKDLLVRKNKLINAKIKLTSKAYDITRAFISLVERDDTDFWTYSISASSLDLDYKRAKKYIKEIMGKPVELQDDKNEIFHSYSWFSTMKYEKGIVQAKINPDLRDMMLQIKEGNFTKTFEKYILPMESIYAKRLYELLVSYKDLGYRKFELSKLQIILDTEYDYSNFKKWVLIPAIKDINKYTDIYLDLPLDDLQAPQWVKLQCGRKRGITHLNFKIEANSNNIAETKAKNSEVKNEDIKDLEQFREMFAKFQFDLKEFDLEFENFKIYNDNNLEKITLDNFKKWCMQKKRKQTQVQATQTTNNEKDRYKWEFKKAQAISNKIKDHLEFNLGINWLEDYYLKDVKEFAVDGIKYGYQDVMHPYFNKEEILLYKIDDDNGQFLIQFKEDEIIDIELIEKK